MKILKLRFCNLNSLYGEWEIDFTSPEYISNGIFAITGATGAGKSTILDAICLGLYGATPRLNNISKSTNEIMSRKTGHCFAEVTFQVNSGIYVCHWSQHRARKSPDGKLSDSKHEISDFKSQKILANKKRDVANLVIEKSGMDLDRFTRSILLAQGSFSAFLKATADERAPILEQITGTEIYSDISRKIHERLRLESETYSLLIAETEGITFLSEDEEANLKVELTSAELLEKESSAKIETLNNYTIWINKVLNLKNEVLGLSERYNSVLKRVESFKLDKEFLSKVIKAGELDGDYAIIKKLSELQQRDSLSLKVIDIELPTLLENRKKSEDKYKNLELCLKEKKELYIKEQILIKHVREVDYDINQTSLLLKDRQTEYKEVQEKTIQLEAQIKNTIEEKKSIQAELNISEKYLISNESDGNIIIDLSGLKQQMEIYKESLDRDYFRKINIDKQNVLIKGIDKKQSIKIEEFNKITEEKESISLLLTNEHLKLKKELKGKELREYRSELKSLNTEKMLLDKISSLENEREKLLEGSACPLCGSKDHPYILEVHLGNDEIDNKIKKLEMFIEEIETIELNIRGLELKISNIDKLVSESEKSVYKSKLELEELIKSSNRLKDESIEYLKKDNILRVSLVEKLKPYGFKEVDLSSIENIIISLENRSRLWSTYSQKSTDLKSILKELESNVLRITEDLKSENVILVNKKNIQNEIIQKMNLSIKSRKEIFKDKDPDVEDQRFKNEILNLENDIKSLQTINEKQLQVVVSLNTRLESLSKNIEQRDIELNLKKMEFEVLYKSYGFLDIKNYTKYRISQEEKSCLVRKSEQLDGEFSTVTARKNDSEARLKLEIDKTLTDRELVDIQEELDIYKKGARSLGEKIGAIKQQLENNTLAISRLKEKKDKIKSQKVELENWQKLHSLIGSADGKKFRNFAQGLTFEQMVYYANRELIKLSDRYLLIRDSENPLELNVVDNYQAGEIRSTKNLSGGESFIISLALALGLSHMASNKVRVDSLFLDEGFGTLDEEALEVALDTLAGLHQDGKLIGVISHVPALKQRILTQINISKSAGGRGLLSGPGCKHL